MFQEVRFHGSPLLLESMNAGMGLASTVHMVSVRWLFLIPLLLGSCLQTVEKPRREQTRATADTTSDALFSPPSPETIYGDQRGEQIRLGYEIVGHTHEYAAPYVG